MKKYLLLFSILTAFFAKAAAPLSNGDEDYKPSEEATHIPAMIQVEDEDVDAAIADLREKGVTVLRHRGNILLTYIPVETVDNLRKARGVGKIELPKPRYNTPLMNTARNFNNASYISEGKSLPQPYTGKGVVVGVCDVGMDTRHSNFLNRTKDECRIRLVVHYEEQQGKRTVYSTPKDIYDWQTDNPDDWHATHVTGIAAGGDKDSPYYSLAPDADIVFTASQLSDVGLLAGVEDIIEYAKSQNKPAVVNLSMGNYIGPHDGRSLFSQYLDLCASDAIICLSAGNEGEGGMPRSASFDFTPGNEQYRVCVCDYAGKDTFGQSEVWSDDDTPFSFAFYWRSAGYGIPSEGEYQRVVFNEETTSWRISADPTDPDYDEFFGKHFNEGYVEVTGGISPLNGRYHAFMEFYIKTDERYVDNQGVTQGWGIYWPAMSLRAEPGAHVDVFCGGDVRLHQEPGSPAPDNKMCISDLATGFRTISVGMTNNTDIYEGRPEGSGYAKGDVSIYSSYGTLRDGRVLPVTCAPGAYVVSSISSAFLENHPDNLQYVDDSSLYNGNTYYWIGTLGTSMSCPFVVSAIATWLQANPHLTSEEALDIIKKTNQTGGYPNVDDPRHGQGWFNAYDGMQKVLDLSALKTGTLDAPTITVRVEKGMLYIGNPADLKLSVEIYSMAGSLVDRRTFTGTTGSLDLASLGSGIYIIRVVAPGQQTETLKIVI